MAPLQEQTDSRPRKRNRAAANVTGHCFNSPYWADLKTIINRTWDVTSGNWAAIFSFFIPHQDADGIADRLWSHQVKFAELDPAEIFDSKCLFRFQTDQHLRPKITHRTQTKHWLLEKCQSSSRLWYKRGVTRWLHQGLCVLNTKMWQFRFTRAHGDVVEIWSIGSYPSSCISKLDPDFHSILPISSLNTHNLCNNQHRGWLMQFRKWKYRRKNVKNMENSILSASCKPGSHLANYWFDSWCGCGGFKVLLYCVNEYVCIFT